MEYYNGVVIITEMRAFFWRDPFIIAVCATRATRTKPLLRAGIYFHESGMN